jgi:hypothetical protein
MKPLEVLREALETGTPPTPKIKITIEPDGPPDRVGLEGMLVLQEGEEEGEGERSVGVCYQGQVVVPARRWRGVTDQGTPVWLWIVGVGPQNPSDIQKMELEFFEFNQVGEGRTPLV